jgi:hypothetical protein
MIAKIKKVQYYGDNDERLHERLTAFRRTEPSPLPERHGLVENGLTAFEGGANLAAIS